MYSPINDFLKLLDYWHPMYSSTAALQCFSFTVQSDLHAHLIIFSLFLAGIFEPYVPPEGDARLSTLSKEGLKQRTEQLKQTAASHLAYVLTFSDFYDFFFVCFLCVCVWCVFSSPSYCLVFIHTSHYLVSSVSFVSGCPEHTSSTRTKEQW